MEQGAGNGGLFYGRCLCELCEAWSLVRQGLCELTHPVGSWAPGSGRWYIVELGVCGLGHTGAPGDRFLRDGT